MKISYWIFNVMAAGFLTAAFLTPRAKPEVTAAYAAISAALFGVATVCWRIK